MGTFKGPLGSIGLPQILPVQVSTAAGRSQTGMFIDSVFQCGQFYRLGEGVLSPRQAWGLGYPGASRSISSSTLPECRCGLSLHTCALRPVHPILAVKGVPCTESHTLGPRLVPPHASRNRAFCTNSFPSESVYSSRIQNGGMKL